MNVQHEQYGAKRLESVLQTTDGKALPPEVVALLKDSLAAFVGQAEASDDMTMLVLRWAGRK